MFSKIESSLERSGSGHVAAGRIDAIDFLRGVAIIDMTLSHFSSYLPSPLSKIVSYTDIAMPLFVLLSGFMIGQHYFPRFQRDPAGVTRRLLTRALQILVIQYIIIATVNVPLHLIGFGSVGRDEPLWLFTLKSAALLNQVGIVHVLPTFIPLFLVSPLILFLFKTNREWLVILSSAALFAVGHFSPHLLDLGDPTVFPFLVIQIYFVAGCLWGKAAQAAGSIAPRKLAPWLAGSGACLALVFFVRRVGILPDRLVSAHPLNFFGLCFQVPILATLVLGTVQCWRVIRAVPFLYAWMGILGRHALLAFVLHLYCAKAIGVLNFAAAVPALLNYALIVASVALAVFLLHLYEKRDRSRPTRWLRALDALFK